MLKMKFFMCITLCALLAKSSAEAEVEDEKVVKKRQIFREQVLPHAGGKIPDTAFQTDRLLLNRLQKEGIAVPDGVILEQRNPQVFPYLNKATRAVYKVAVTQDGRYTPVEGQYVYNINSPPSLETTYLYPQIHNHPIRVPSSIPKYPQYKTLTIPNPLARDSPQHSATKPPRKIYLVSYEVKPSTKSASSAFINIRNTPLAAFSSSSSSSSHLPQDYITSQIFNDFDDFFSGFNFREIRSTDRLT